ncbi:hypothetical protein AWN76_014275 [Rhodothermaceae bacterium RA]|nr:hypothetical protein AWN76_014275 [Rhodothermaceae bacterium RA]
MTASRRHTPRFPGATSEASATSIAHVYWNVDYDIVWNVISEDVPRLHRQLRTLFDSLEEDE